MPLAAVGVGLWRSAGGDPDAPAASSEVESPALRMTLDHDSGGMDGEVTAGRLPRRPALRALAPSDLDRLLSPSSRPRATRTAWRCSSPGSTATAARGAAAAGRPAAAGRRRAMTEAEAYRVLGLAPGASLEEVRAAYRRLIRRVHPDLGGSSALAALLNAAKELLDPG